ncbi:MAG: hypothetical protein Q9157_001921 [Trypethelium eluteriae]
MMIAFKQLDYTGFYHMTSIMHNPPDTKMWIEYLRWKHHGEGRPFTRKDWDQLLGHAQVCCDVPLVCALPDLIATYPEAEVILVERDPDSWYESSYSGTSKFLSSRRTQVLATLDTRFTRPLAEVIQLMFAILWGPKGWQEPEQVVKRRYHELHEDVRRLVPPERLLGYKIGKGWAPLCEFLGKEVPDTPFPRVNERKEFSERLNYMLTKVTERLLWGAMPYAAVVTVAAIAVTYSVWAMDTLGAGILSGRVS